MNTGKLNKILINSAVILSVFYLAVFYWTSYSRINYQFELEWMEGGMLQHVERINDGKDIYYEPSAEFVPFIYSPFYFYAASVSTKIFGEELFSLRLVSLASVSVSFLLIFLITFNKTKDFKLGIISAGLFAGVYGLTGSFYDLARVDSLFSMLILLTFFLIQRKNIIFWILASFAGILAFYTKQSAIGIFLPLLIFLMIYDRKRLMIFGLPLVVSVILLIVTMNHSSNGIFSLYIFDIPSTFDLLPVKGVKFIFFDIFKPFALGVVAVIFVLIELYKSNKGEFALTAGLFLGMLTYSFFSRMHWGGYDNVLIPAYAVFALSVPAAYYYLKNSGRNLVLPTILIIAQLLFLIYKPMEYIPVADDLKSGKEIVERIKSIEGEVYIPSHPYLLKMAGKIDHAHSMAVLDVMSLGNIVSEKLAREIDSLVSSKHYSAIITDNHWVINNLEEYYYYGGDVSKGNSFFTVCGLKSRPEKIWFPRP